MNGGSTLNTGLYRRRCDRCARFGAQHLRIEARGEDWVVFSSECAFCGIDGRSLVGERGPRAIALLRNDRSQREVHAKDGVGARADYASIVDSIASSRRAPVADGAS